MSEATTFNPTTISAALKVKAKKNVVAVAGGTDLLVRLHDWIDKPWPALLVLEGVRQLRKISANAKYISIGPLITFSELEKSELLKLRAPQLAKAASLAGSVQIRNRATIGGNIANGSPAGDLIPPLYVLGAELELSSIKGKRIIPIDKFFIGPGKTILKPNELITAFKIKKITNHGFFNRLANRQALAISKISVAASVMLKHGDVTEIKIAFGAVAPTVIRAPKTEQALLGKKLCPGIISIVSEIAKTETHPIDDLRSNAEYRREMVGVLLTRGLTKIYESLPNVSK
jgi:CO/xanthine dehydrogenase FAD-binding subunit